MRHTEEDLQIACKRWWNLQYSKWSELLYHTPNGGYRTAREGARFKAAGVVAGVADLTLAIARHGYHALFIELKTPTGRQSSSQKNFQRKVEEQGYKYIVVRSIDEFIREIKDYLDE